MPTPGGVQRRRRRRASHSAASLRSRSARLQAGDRQGRQQNDVADRAVQADRTCPEQPRSWCDPARAPSGTFATFYSPPSEIHYMQAVEAERCRRREPRGLDRASSGTVKCHVVTAHRRTVRRQFLVHYLANLPADHDLGFVVSKFRISRRSRSMRFCRARSDGWDETCLRSQRESWSRRSSGAGASAPDGCRAAS